MGFRANIIASTALTCAIAGGFAGAPTNARAEDVSATPGLAANVIDEVIVTARKREESAQTVPIALTALSATALEARGVQRFGDVAKFAPNITFDQGQGIQGGSASASIYVRGIGQNDPSPTADPGVGVYVDGVYLGRTVGSMLDVLDVNRIEILRGPQGTLFGKNTIGGAVSIVSSLPTHELGGSVQVDAGSFNERNVRASVNFPISDTVDAKISASSRQRDGYGHSLVTGDDFGDVDRQNGRLAVTWRPNDKVTFTLLADVSKQREASEFIRPISVNPTLPALTVLYNSAVASKTPYVAYDARWVSPQTFTNYSSGPSKSDFDASGASGDLRWRLTDDIELTSITAFRRSKAHQEIDADGSPLPLSAQSYITNQKQFSEEVRLGGSSFKNRLNWTAGLYYFDEKIHDITQARLLQGLYQATGSNDQVGYQDFTPHNKSGAAFAQATYRFSDVFSVTGGLRYNKDDKTVGAFSFRPISGLIRIPAGTTRHQSWSSWTPKLSVEYQPTTDALIYGSMSQGFKSGGYNYQVGAPTDFLPFNPEKATTYEAGFKTDWFGHRLRANGAIFHTNYQDMQLRYRAGPGQFACPTTASNCSIVVNAGRVRIRGAELEITARPAPGLELFTGIGLLDNKFTQIDPLLVAGKVISYDTKLPKTPDRTYNLGAQYDRDLGQGRLTMRVDYSYRSAVFTEISNDPRLRQAGYGLLGARIAYTPSGPRWEIAISGQNLTDKVYITSGSSSYTSLGYDDVTLGVPRTVTASLKYRFGD